MSYTPPDSGNVDFSVESYNVPGSDNVNFDVFGGVLVSVDPVVLSLTADNPGLISPSKRFFSVGAIPLQFDLDPDPLISSGVLLTPDTLDLELDIDSDPLISSGVLLTPDTLSLELDIPLAAIQPFLYNTEWQIDKQRISPSQDIETDPQSLTLTFEVAGSDLDKWRVYDRAGDLATEDGFAGSFRALDRSDQGPVEVRSSFDDMRPFEPSLEYFVAGYSESQIAPDRYEISLDLQRPRNRGQAFPAINETGGEWVIETERSTVALSGDQVGTIDSDGSTTGPRRQLGLVVSDDQAAALIDDLGFPAGISTRSVPDGEDILVDDSGSQSITLTAPPGADIDNGEWLVPEWTLSFQSFDDSRRWRVEVTLAR